MRKMMMMFIVISMYIASINALFYVPQAVVSLFPLWQILYVLLLSFCVRAKNG